MDAILGDGDDDDEVGRKWDRKINKCTIKYEKKKISHSWVSRSFLVPPLVSMCLCKK